MLFRFLRSAHHSHCRHELNRELAKWKSVGIGPNRGEKQVDLSLALGERRIQLFSRIQTGFEMTNSKICILNRVLMFDLNVRTIRWLHQNTWHNRRHLGYHRTSSMQIETCNYLTVIWAIDRWQTSDSANIVGLVRWIRHIDRGDYRMRCANKQCVNCVQIVCLWIAWKWFDWAYGSAGRGPDRKASAWTMPWSHESESGSYQPAIVRQSVPALNRRAS